jgi:hypothetical protein
MYERIVLWVGVGVLLLLCLPISRIQKLVLEISAWALRLAMIALLAAGAYLWFRPGQMPADVSNVLNDFPGLLALLPERGSPEFALCLACWTVAALVPFLAVLDVSRKLAGRMHRIRTLTAQPVAASAPVEPVVVAAPPPPPPLRPVDRRTAASVLTAAGTRVTR